ncbi:MAG: branched-chain amino acid ABC transporter permease [bacterium]|nr:branched-chain amino acid ABC transporter permease [bacterium]
MDKFLQLLLSGVALGGIYALVALGFVVVYKSSGAFNFAQGGFVTLGAYMVYQFGGDWGLPFWLGLVLAMLAMAAVGMFLERLAIRPMVGRPAFAVVLITLGLLLVIEQVVRAVWTMPGLVLSVPWGNGRSRLGEVTLRHADLWSMVSAAVLLAAFFGFFRYSRTGLAMRATAADQEAAAAQGISPGRSFAVSWAVAAATAPVAGVMLVSRGGGALSPAVGFTALAAFPAMILGGLDSIGGAVLGGALIGVAEVMSQGYLDVSWLGSNAETVVPYAVMVAVLLWRPEGLLGTRRVERV